MSDEMKKFFLADNIESKMAEDEFNRARENVNFFLKETNDKYLSQIKTTPMRVWACPYCNEFLNYKKLKNSGLPEVKSYKCKCGEKFLFSRDGIYLSNFS